VELAAEDEDQQLAWKVVAEAERAMEARDGRRSIERAGGGRSGALGARKGRRPGVDGQGGQCSLHFKEYSACFTYIF
jgi:hypothetical protein